MMPLVPKMLRVCYGLAKVTEDMPWSRFMQWVLQAQQNHAPEFPTFSQWAVASHAESHGHLSSRGLAVLTGEA